MRRTLPRAADAGRATRPIRVLVVCGALRPGFDGVADYVVRLAEVLRERGAEVRILHTGASTDVRGARSIGTGWGPAALLRACATVRGADVVHAQFAPSMYRFRAGIGLLPIVSRRVPLVTTLHEYGWWRWESRLPAAAWRLLERVRAADRETVLLVPRSRAVLTTNDGHAAAVHRRFGGGVATRTVPIGANVDVVPTDREEARRSVRAGLGLGPDAVLLAFFGFVHPVKGVRYLAEAVAALAGEGRDVHLLVVGGFESLALPDDEARAFEAELRGQVAAAGAGERVVFTGFRAAAEASRLLTAADAAVLPFTAGVTAKSGSLLTVLAHRLATIVTAGPEPDRALVDGGPVVVVPEVRDGPALASGIRRVLDDPALAAAIADRGAAFAAVRDWGRIADAHLAVYREVSA